MGDTKKKRAAKGRGTLSTIDMVVQGTLRRSDGRPLAGALVRALDVNLRSEDLLGEAKSEEDGWYEIPYTLAKLKRAKKKAADLRTP